MKVEEQVRLVKIIGSDAELFASFLGRLAGFVYFSTNAERFNSSFEWSSAKIKLKGVFNYRCVSLKEKGLLPPKCEPVLSKDGFPSLSDVFIYEQEHEKEKRRG